MDDPTHDDSELAQAGARQRQGGLRRALGRGGMVWLAALVLSAALPSSSLAAFGFLAKWGSYGSGDGQFMQPTGVATDSAGNVYVADSANDRIEKFTSTGTFLGKWGSQGSGDGQFGYPSDIATDTAGNVYVADWGNYRIEKFTSTGAFLGKWGSYGSGDGQFIQPTGVATDPAGNVYVTEGVWTSGLSNRVEKFTSTGTFLGKWGSQGSGDGQFSFEEFSGLDTDSAGNVYVADSGNDRIEKFTSTGTFLGKWGSRGSGDGQFYYPSDVATDTAGNVYVADRAGGRIEKFTSDGTFLGEWDSYAIVSGLATDAAGDVYVADWFGSRIQKFGQQPPLTGGSTASESGPSTAPTGKRATALKKCDKKKPKNARKKCRKRARRLPV